MFYLIQDAHYLAVFARALALTAAKAPSADHQVKFAKSAMDAILVERSLHEDFFSTFGVTPARFAATEPSPTCEAYGNFLLAQTYAASFPVCVAAVLPCFQIYFEVGRELLNHRQPGNPFQLWIDTYADEAFGRSVREVKDACDQAHATASASEQASMRRAHLLASRYEWLFWDRAYARETWSL